MAAERRSRTRVVVADQAAERGDQRRVGELVAAELDALAADRAAAPFAGAVDEGVEEAGLADARLARQERQRGRPRGGLVERGLELGELAGSPDQPACAYSGRHPAIIAVRERQAEQAAERAWLWESGAGRSSGARCSPPGPGRGTAEPLRGARAGRPSTLRYIIWLGFIGLAFRLVC